VQRFEGSDCYSLTILRTNPYASHLSARLGMFRGTRRQVRKIRPDNKMTYVRRLAERQPAMPSIFRYAINYMRPITSSVRYENPSSGLCNLVQPNARGYVVFSGLDDG
jgi:hypothetical protein